MTLIMNDATRKLLEETRDFADRIGARDKLEEQLNFLDKYSSHDGVERTECTLYPDCKYSFGFVLYQKGRTYQAVKYSCKSCDSSGVDELIDGKSRWDRCPHCNGTEFEVGEPFDKSVKKAMLFNGALLYYGPGESGVGGPQFSVSLGSLGPEGVKHRWEIHT